jgi:branched-chain amino acid transport system permease protein
MWQQYIVNGLVAGSMHGLLAASFALIYQTARFFHFAHASVFTLGAYLTYFGFRTLGLPLWLAVAGAIVLAGLVGWAQYAWIIGPISRRDGSSISLLLVSLGLMVAMQNLISMAAGDELKILIDRPVGEGLHLGFALVTPVQMWMIGCSAGALVCLGCFLSYTRYGLRIRAVADDPELATAFGLDPKRLTAGAFGVGSMMAAATAVLATLDTGLTPSMGFNALLMAVVAVVIGGVGSIPGALLGGLVIGLIQHLASAVVPTAWVESIAFLILIGFLLLRPHGLMGQIPARK